MMAKTGTCVILFRNHVCPFLACSFLPSFLRSEQVAEQLRCAGVVEAIRISRAAYPNRMARTDFIKRWAACSPPRVCSGRLIHPSIPFFCCGCLFLVLLFFFCVVNTSAPQGGWLRSCIFFDQICAVFAVSCPTAAKCLSVPVPFVLSFAAPAISIGLHAPVSSYTAAIMLLRFSSCTIKIVSCSCSCSCSCSSFRLCFFLTTNAAVPLTSHARPPLFPL